MFSMQTLKEKQPVGWTGIVRYIGIWLLSSRGERIYRNPVFKPGKNDRDDAGIGIYCIHGTADIPASFQLIARRLLEKKLPESFSTIHLAAFNNRWQGEEIEKFSKQLLDKIKLNQHKHVVLIGHSRGGLVAACFAESFAKDADIHVHGIMTIGAPFKGSVWAKLPISKFSKSVEEMQPGSDSLRKLEQKMQVSSLPYTHFAAEEDYIVSVDSSRGVASPEQVVALARHGHMSIMSSHKLVDEIKSKLESVHEKHIVDYPRLTEDEFREKMLNDFALLDNSDVGVAHEICQAIDLEIAHLLNRAHYSSANQKEDALKALKTALIEALINGKVDLCPSATTIGQFIRDFLTENTNASGKTLMQVICAHLNPPILLTGENRTKTHQFIESLIMRFESVSIVSRSNKHKQLRRE